MRARVVTNYREGRVSVRLERDAQVRLHTQEFYAFDSATLQAMRAGRFDPMLAIKLTEQLADSLTELVRAVGYACAGPEHKT